MDNVVLQMENIRKEFPGVLALNNVSLTVLKGEVHALMGENGAGKSTLIKILTGIYTKDAGTITFCGKEVDFQTAKQAQDGGISTIYQELNLIPQMSVAENMFLGRQPIKNGSIDWKQIYSETNKIMEDLGISVDIHLPLSRYSTAIQQMVAIARAVSLDAKLVIMDEPTSSLGENEVRTLFDIIRKIRDRGIAVIFISHRMDEIFEICDRVTILRDGCLVETDLISEIDKYKLITKMIGRDAGEVMQIRKQAKDDLDSQDIVFEAHNITKGVKVRGIDLTIKRGEVVGLAGLLGAGRTEFARAIFAADKMDAGEILIDGKKVKFRSSRDAVRSGIGFLSEDRKAEGITPHLTVRENMTLAILRKISSAGWISKKKELKNVDFYSKKLKVKTPSYEQEIRNLSGGNQQKVILARWMATQPKLLILDEPTRGIDVGAKAEIEELIHEMSSNGISILFISSEFEELIRNCDRIAVIRDGKKVMELKGKDISEQGIFHAISENSEEHNSGNKEHAKIQEGGVV